MRRALLASTSLLVLVAGLAAAAVEPDFKRFLPPDATVVVTREFDVTGDGRPEIVLGYTTSRKGLPPTQGRAAVLERDRAGAFRRFDLVGAWPGHYPPRFSVTDLTGDGRPELVELAGGGSAWGTLRVFRRAAEGYEMLLEDDAQGHVLWDADGDGRPEVIARKRLRLQADQSLQRFIWRDGRFLVWHAPEWSYIDTVSPERALPDLKGLNLQQADEAVRLAGFNLGVIAALDIPGPAGRVVRYARDGREVHVAVGAGDTTVTLPPLPPVSGVYYESGTEPGTAPIAVTETQRTRWRDWLAGLAGGAQQAVHTRNLSSQPGPLYFLELQAPWRVRLGEQTQEVRWVGVGTSAPYRGLLFLAPGLVRPGYVYPDFRAAMFSVRNPLPVPVEPERPLPSYLKVHPEVDAFVTVWPAEWTHSVRLRGIATSGWPAPEFAPHLEGMATPDPDTSPMPDHVMVTVLNGFVRRAVREGDEVTVKIVPAPGRAYRWPLPLTGFNRSTQVVRVHLEVPGQAPATRDVMLESWRDWSGSPGPGSLVPE